MRHEGRPFQRPVATSLSQDLIFLTDLWPPWQPLMRLPVRHAYQTAQAPVIAKHWENKLKSSALHNGPPPQKYVLWSLT